MQSMIDPEAVQRLADRNGLGKIFSSTDIAAMELRRYGDGEVICSVGDRLESMFILMEGKLKIHTLLPNGKSMLVRFARPMSVIGDVELLRQYPVKNEVVSVGSSLLLVASRKMPAGAGGEYGVAAFSDGELSHKMYTLGQTSALNLLYPVENRFASYLMSLFEETVGGQRVEEIRTSSLTETADLLGTSYRHLNRIVRRFIDEGIIERKRGRLSVLDQTRLAQLANGNLYE